jgi:hypothetical protein
MLSSYFFWRGANMEKEHVVSGLMDQGALLWLKTNTTHNHMKATVLVPLKQSQYMILPHKKSELLACHRYSYMMICRCLSPSIRRKWRVSEGSAGAPRGVLCLEFAGSGGIRSCAPCFTLTVWF